MKKITEEMIRKVIESIDQQKFNTHDFIEMFMRINPKSYIEELYEFRNNNDPFRKVHSDIGRELLKCSYDIIKTGICKSKNVKGQDTVTALWKKIESNP